MLAITIMADHQGKPNLKKPEKTTGPKKTPPRTSPAGWIEGVRGDEQVIR